MLEKEIEELKTKSKASKTFGFVYGYISKRLDSIVGAGGKGTNSEATSQYRSTKSG